MDRSGLRDRPPISSGPGRWPRIGTVLWHRHPDSMPICASRQVECENRPGPLRSRRGTAHWPGVLGDLLVDAAQVHAALAAVIAMAIDFGNRAEADAWREAAGTAMNS
jgi:hypothetical protein